MHSVKVNRTELLVRIKTNRDEHRKLFLKAQEGYRAAIIEELDRMLQEARDGKEIRRHISLPEPQDHTLDYDRVIDMLQMSQDNIIEIADHEFDQFVRDNWSWKGAFDTTSAMYSTRINASK